MWEIQPLCNDQFVPTGTAAQRSVSHHYATPPARRVAIGPQRVEGDHDVWRQKATLGMIAAHESDSSCCIDVAVKSLTPICSNCFSGRDGTDRDCFGHFHDAGNATGRCRWPKRRQQKRRYQHYLQPHAMCSRWSLTITLMWAPAFPHVAPGCVSVWR